MPNTQDGLPLKDHLWKLPSLGTQPTSLRCALAFPRGFATGQIHGDELLRRAAAMPPAERDEADEPREQARAAGSSVAATAAGVRAGVG